MKQVTDFKIRPACLEDVPVILQLIHDLATYERAPDEVSATEEQLVEVLFGEKPAAEVLLAFEEESPGGFADYFYNFFPPPQPRGKIVEINRTLDPSFVFKSKENLRRAF